MNFCGIRRACNSVFALCFLLVTFCATSSFASGVLIFSSWDTKEKATTDAERISGILEQKTTTMEATVNDRKVFRVVVAVETDEDRSALVQTAEGKNLKPWYLPTEKLAEADNASEASADPAPTDEAAGASSTGDQKVVLGVSDADPDAVLNYLDQATIDSTLAKLDAVRKRAQDLIPEFEPRDEELPPLEEIPDMPQGEQEQESEEQTETSSTE